MPYKPIPSIKESVERAKYEILSDLDKNLFEKDIRSFSDLHNYLNTNDYAGFNDESLMMRLTVHFKKLDEKNGTVNSIGKYINTVHRELDDWIKSGVLW
jgi:hypothetical protein